MVRSVLVARWTAAGYDRVELARALQRVLLDYQPGPDGCQRWHLDAECAARVLHRETPGWYGYWTVDLLTLELDPSGCPTCTGPDARAAAFELHGVSVARWLERAMLLAARTQALARLTHPAELAFEAWRLDRSAEHLALAGPVVDAAHAAARAAFARRDAALDPAALLGHPAATATPGVVLVTAIAPRARTGPDPLADRTEASRAAQDLLWSWLTPAGVVRALPAGALGPLAEAAGTLGWTLATCDCPAPGAGVAAELAAELVARGLAPTAALAAAVAILRDGP